MNRRGFRLLTAVLPSALRSLVSNASQATAGFLRNKVTDLAFAELA
jgi:hypothetical protein